LEIHGSRIGRLAGLMAVNAIGSAQADVEGNGAAIAARLADWTAAFNATRPPSATSSRLERRQRRRGLAAHFCDAFSC
jgi:hypothetical protein